MASEVVDPQVISAMTTTNTKSWHDVHMGIAAGMSQTHANTVGALNTTFVTNIGLLQKRIVETTPEEAVSERLMGGVGQAAVQGDQGAALANIIDQLGTAVAALQQILKGAQTTIPVTVTPPAGG